MEPKPRNPFLVAIGARMEGLLAESRVVNQTFEHNGLRGTVRELFVEEFLSPFLPANIGIGTGEIINHVGQRSAQVDVVLYNKGMVPPFIARNSSTGLFPWESVIAVIEVKSTMNSDICDAAWLNAHSVQKVVIGTPQKGTLIGGKNDPEDAISRAPIPYFVFAFSSDLTPNGKEWDRLVQRKAHWVEKHNENAREINGIEENLPGDEKSPKDQDENYIESKKSLARIVEKFQQFSSVAGLPIHGIYVPGKDSKYRVLTLSKIQKKEIQDSYTVYGYDDQVLSPNAEEVAAAYFLKQILQSYEVMVDARHGYTVQRYFDQN